MANKLREMVWYKETGGEDLRGLEEGVEVKGREENGGEERERQ